MQILKSHVLVSQVKKNFLKGFSNEVIYRFEKLESWQNLKEENCDDVTIFQALKVSRATLFRWQKLYEEYGLEGLQSISRKPSRMRIATEQNEIRNDVFKCRKKYPLFGKHKIKIMLQEDYGVSASVGTIGIVISKLIKHGKIPHVNDVCGKRIRRQRRTFNDHAQPFLFGMKAKELGEMIQVDHMTENPFKHYAAICPISKLIFAYAYRQATALTSVDFLQRMLLFFPFKVRSIQVDGGSEFIAEFEQACKKLNVALYVLPPRSPKLNGCVERSNGTMDYEFYALYPRFSNIHDLNMKLAEFSRFYNEKRPHQRLNYLTPLRYLESRRAENNVF